MTFAFKHPHYDPHFGMGLGQTMLYSQKSKFDVTVKPAQTTTFVS